MSENKKRYFIVWYKCKKFGANAEGIIAFEIQGGFIRNDAVVAKIEEAEGISKTYITNFKEITESDFEHWIKSSSEFRTSNNEKNRNNEKKAKRKSR